MQKMSEKEAIEWLKAISATQKESIHTSSLLNRKEALHIAIQTLEEIQQYRAIGTVDELKDAILAREELKRRDKYLVPVKDRDREELQEYKAIGTLDECREAVERMKPKKLDIEARAVGEYLCGNCYEPIPRWDTRYCPNCGHAIDRSE